MDAPVPAWRCRWCRSDAGDVVLDLGDQPPAGLLPAPTDPLPDPTEPLRLVLCRRCGLAQLEADGSPPTERPGVEPEAMVAQGRRVVDHLAAHGLLGRGTTYRQHPSPHGGDWGGLVEAEGARPWTAGDGPPDLVLDVFGIMHDVDLASAWRDRVAQLGPDSVLVVQYHSLAGDIDNLAWHTARPGHYTSLSASVLLDLAQETSLVPLGHLQSDLQGGTGVLLLGRADRYAAASEAVRDQIDDLRRAEEAAGVRDADALRVLGAAARDAAGALHGYVAARRAEGLTVAGYGAASRTPTILTLAGLDSTDLRYVADASPGKQGRALPGGRIPVVAPATLDSDPADRVLLFVPELLDEVRRAHPAVEAGGGRWVVLDPEPHELQPAADAVVMTRGSLG